MKTWTVRLNDRVRPLIERIAHEEERPAAQVGPRLLEGALKQHQVATSHPSPIGETA
jgi:hypothetical protein